MIIQTYQGGVARKLATGVADPGTRLIVDEAALASLGPATVAAAADADAKFQKALKGFVYGQIGVPSPLTLRVLPGLSAMVTPPGGSDIPLLQALGLMEDALSKEMGPSAFAGMSIVLTAHVTLPKLFDATQPPFDRVVVGAKLVKGAAQALEGVWPVIGPWREVLGVAIQAADIGKLVYLGCETQAVSFTPAVGSAR
jgi:hypothetical protein